MTCELRNTGTGTSLNLYFGCLNLYFGYPGGRAGAGAAGADGDGGGGDDGGGVPTILHIWEGPWTITCREQISRSGIHHFDKGIGCERTSANK